MSTEEIDMMRTRYDDLIRSVFRTPAGEELLKQWVELYLESDLFSESERQTCYTLGQRDFVLEITAKLKETMI